MQDKLQVETAVLDLLHAGAWQLKSW